MRILTFIAVLIFSCINAIAGGTSYNIKILSLKETNPERYTMTFQRVVTDGQDQPPAVILRLRHNDYYYSKKTSSTYTKETYLKAIKILQDHSKTGKTFAFGAMGGAWGIPVEGSKNEYWVQTVAIVEEFDGSMVVYAFKE